MCENLLKTILTGALKVENLIKWLKIEEIEEESLNVITSFECSQGEFILYFLNFLHEETSSILQSFSKQATPIRIKTPRRIEVVSSKSMTASGSKKLSTRRTALFPDKQASQNQNDQLLGVSALESDNQPHNSPSRVTSTPRLNKSRHSFDRTALNSSENSFRDSLHPMSPISPVYSKNRSGLDSKDKSSTAKTSSGLCLGDFIVTKKSSAKKKHKQLSTSVKETNGNLDQTNDRPNIENCLNQSNLDQSFDGSKRLFSEEKNIRNKSAIRINTRRINPTNVSHDSGLLNSKRITPHDTSNSFSFTKSIETEVTAENSRDQRDILREERLKYLSRSKTVDANNFVDVLSTRSIRTQSISIIQPNIDLVTFRSELDTLSLVYSTLIDLNLVLNPLSELYFLISLILIQGDSDFKIIETTEKIEELRTTLENSLTNVKERNIEIIDGLFKTVHNCVYFAAAVLHRQSKILSVLDRATLKLLQENCRLKIFAPDLTKKLVVFHSKKSEQKNESFTKISGENVSFISDTDNRENFPSDSSFHAFRKQRDLFYELLRSWDTNHMQSGWSFSSALSSKIKALISMHSDPVNLMHLARLFKNQLLAEFSQTSDPVLLPTCLNGLVNVDASKLSRLRDRLVSKKSTGGPSPDPSFTGRQEFYKEFILVSASPSFCRHLVDCFVADILQLDDTAFWPSDFEDSDAVLDSGIKSLYINSLRSLKLLAKFLGFLDSLPYKSDCPPNHQMLAAQIAIRKHFRPSVDVVHLLQEAQEVGKLSLTIPWVADYLAMLDHTTLRLPYFVRLIEALYEIHYTCHSNFGASQRIEQPLMIKLCLGWLFERSNFPLESYQGWVSKKYQLQVTENIKTELVVNSSICGNLNIDRLDLVDETVLFTCCPYLTEIRNCLSADPNSNYNKSGPVKYIRPISTVGDNTDQAKKRLQAQLEDAFFHNQPASLKRTIDLVSERVASACVKHICNNLVPAAKLKGLNIFISHLEHLSTLTTNAIREQTAVCCIKRAKELSDQCFEEFKQTSREEIENCCKKRCENSLKSLLSDDVHPTTGVTCLSITLQQTRTRIKEWFSSHVNPGVFLKEFVSEMENVKHGGGQKIKPISYRLPPRGKNVEHNPDASSPVVLLTKLREMMYQVLESPEQITIDLLTQLINEASLTCCHRCDLNPMAQFMMCKLFLDMYIMLAQERPDIADNFPLIDSLLYFWKQYLASQQRENFFERILCPRNAGMFCQSRDPSRTWMACSQLLVALLKENMLKTEQFEKQAIAMFRYEWPPNSTKYFAECLQRVVDDIVRRTGNGENFTFIVSWIADYCNDEEFF